MHKAGIRAKVLVPLAIVLALLTATFATSILWLNGTLQDHKLTRELSAVTDLLRTESRSQAEVMQAVLEAVMRDETLRQLQRSRDRNGILGHAGPLFDHLRSDRRITHFYFLDPALVVVARMHNPAGFGDTIARFTATSARDTGMPSQGLEVGKYGSVTLRVTVPWKHDGETLGYLELGKGLHLLLEQIHGVLQTDLVVLLDKSRLDRESWEEGLTVFGHVGRWDAYPRQVLAYTTMSPLPADLEDLLAEDGVASGELTLTDASGGRELRGSFSPLRDSAGERIGRILALSDVSHHLAATRRTLVVMVASGTGVVLALVLGFGALLGRVELELDARAKALLHQKRQAEAALEARAAERANLSKGEFLANMSHELRTPMTAILGYCEVMLDEEASGGKSSDRVHAARLIQRNSHHLLELIDDILDLSKIEAKKLHVESIAYSPATVISDVMDLMQVRADASGLDLSARLETPVPERIQGDPTRLRQILVNLLGNAIKFTSAGRVELRVGLVDRDTDPRLAFTVVDTGIGITAEHLSTLFQPFQQADASVSRQYGGTGLGLAICRRLTELMGGSITAESCFGSGSSFRFTLPAGHQDGVAMISDLRSRPRGQREGESRDDRHAGAALDGRLLLAEDTPDIRLLISQILRKAGADVEVAPNGQIAFDRIMQEEQLDRPFDAVLMDMQMPVLDGYDATRLLRNAGYTRPIIALTAHAMSGASEACLAAGCDAFLSKPVSRARLIRMMATYLDPEKPADDGPR